MNENQTKTSVSNVSDEVAKKIEAATKLAEKTKRIFIASLFRTILEQKKVKVSIPKEDAKYLNHVSGHKILVFVDEKLLLERLTLIDISDHYVHGDFPIRLANNQVKPTVFRHFCVSKENLGKEIVADVIIKEKTCLLTGAKMIIVDIIELAPGNYSAGHILRLGANVNGNQGEILIPGTDRCIRFDKIRTERIINPIHDEIKEIVTEEKIEKQPEKKHRLTFKAPIREKIEIQPRLVLKKVPKLVLKKQNQN